MSAASRCPTKPKPESTRSNPRCRLQLRRLLAFSVVIASFAVALAVPFVAATTVKESNEEMFRALQETHGLDDAQMARVRAIFTSSGFAGQGNPAIAVHPMTEAECREGIAGRGVDVADAAAAAICGGPFMAPLFDPAQGRAEDATVCIDQFEFPDIPCTYPVVWIRAREAAQVCAAIGKRLCDAHEWEGACAGALLAQDYRFDLAAGVDPGQGQRRMRSAHNQAHAASKTWSYGDSYREGVCATGSHKTVGCEGGGFGRCGSNTYPTGAFPECRSPLGVYDLNGNAAEHMNLPLNPDQMASRGSTELGLTEMKGSWFVFDDFKAHEDWCRWRAPFWHGGRVMAKDSHHNYHLGFRCCKDVARSEHTEAATHPAQTQPAPAQTRSDAPEPR